MRIDHIAIPTPDPVASSAFLAEVLGGLPVKRSGPEGEFCEVTLEDGSFLLFTEGTGALHLAFHLTRPQFTAVHHYLQTHHIPHGNDPDEPTNGQWQDLHGPYGRLYFFDPAGHFYEVVAP